jgi:hypothetical protein
MKLAAFDKLQIGIQLVLKHKQTLALILLPIEVITNQEMYVAGLPVNANTINPINIFDAHERLTIGRDT